MDNLKFTISGLRGVWGQNLNESVVEKYSKGFTVYLQKRGAKTILLGRDARISGPEICAIISNILIDSGISVIDLGVVPTPTIIFLTQHLKIDGAVIVSASHNPREYNGIKFISNRAQYITQEEVDEIKMYINEEPQEKKEKGLYKKDDTLDELHIEHILKNINVTQIQSRKFRVVLDPINSAGYKLGPLLLERLGCSIVTINPFPTGDFAHIPEPLPENLVELGKKVEIFKADIGFALDPDADRLVLCNEKGNVVFEEYTLSLAVKAILKKTPGDIVTNLSTSNTNKDLVESVGFKNYRTKVGEANVVDGIVAHNAVIGGEGGGGVIYPKINLCRDSFTGMGLILELLAQENAPLSTLVDNLPHYVFVKEKIKFSGNLEEIITSISNLFPNEEKDTQDGLRIDFNDNTWVQIRASNTEPLLRIYGESHTEEKINSIIKEIKKCIA